MVLVYDRPLLRSSARGDGALTSNDDRFAIWSYGNPDASIRATWRFTLRDSSAKAADLET
jgi:hypothetical protein